MSTFYRFMPVQRRAVVVLAVFCTAGFVSGFLLSLLVAVSSLMWAIG